MPRHPKPPELRQRRNKATTWAKLHLGGPAVKAPALPIRGCACGGPQIAPPRKKKRMGRPPKVRVCETCGGSGVLPWNDLTVAWWRRLWASPMVGEFIDSDLDVLFRLASLVDRFWNDGGGDAKLAGEIRQQEARFGVTPLDRRRLEWQLEKPEADADETARPEPPPVVDPRVAMRLVR